MASCRTQTLGEWRKLDHSTAVAAISYWHRRLSACVMAYRLLWTFLTTFCDVFIVQYVNAKWISEFRIFTVWPFGLSPKWNIYLVCPLDRRVKRHNHSQSQKSPLNCYANKNYAIANRSRVSCAHNTLRASIGINITPWPWNLGKGSLKVTGKRTIGYTT